MNSKEYASSHRWVVPFMIITLFYWTVGVGLFLKYGVKYVADSERFLEYATNLSNGFFFDPHNFWYSNYATFILAVRLVSDDLSYLILAQYIISYVAVLTLYQASILLFDDVKSALLAALSLILFLEIPTWNSYILAESLYISCICFSLFTLTYLRKHPTPLNVVIVLIAVSFTALIKPTGIAILVASLVALLYSPLQHIRNSWVKWGIVAISIALTLMLTNRMLTTFNIMENYQKGEVIYAITTLPPNQDYKMMVVSPPPSLYVPSENSPPLFKIITFIFHHPVYWFRLFATKLFYFLTHIRPYWSIWHNIFSLAFLLPTYYFFFKATRLEKMEVRIYAFTFSYLAVQILSVCVTSEDWDGRFLSPLLPVLFLFSARGITTRLSRRVRTL